MSNPFLANLLAGKAPAGAAAPATPAAAAPVATPDAGSMAANLKNILGQFAEKSGATRVNPPEAAKVLAVATAAEVAGAAEDVDAEAAGPNVEPPTSKPAEVLAEEAAKRTRRTAAIVQAELDIALERIAVLEKAGAAKSSSKAEDLELIAQLREEAKICEADKAKAHKRADDAEATVVQAVEAITELQRQLSLGAVSNTNLEALPVGMLCDALKALGFEVTLRRL